MGAFCCCQRQEDFEYASPSNGSCCQLCCGRCCCSCCFRCCCGMFSAWLHPSEEQNAVMSVHNASPSQSTGLLGRTSTGTSVPVAYGAPPDIRYHRPQSDVSRTEKTGASPLHGVNSEAVDTSNDGSGGGVIGIQRAKDSDYFEGKTDKDDSFQKIQQSKLAKVGSLTLLKDDEDICPTCLEGYDPENPKIDTKCGHHFHLSCILEWMERSDQCPICDKEMAFSESP